MMLEVTNLNVYYDNIRALKDVSFSVEEGEIMTLIGANGAGKTTTLLTLSGLKKPQSGTIQFLGKDITKTSPQSRVAMGISQSPEGRRVFPGLTVLENLEMGAYLRKDDFSGDMEKVFSYFPRLKERKKQTAGTLSGGEQQMLAMGRALMSRPKLMLLDEPSMGLSPLLVSEIFEIIRRLNENGTTILLVEQNAALALKLAHRAAVMETGRIVLAKVRTHLQIFEDRQPREHPPPLGGLGDAHGHPALGRRLRDVLAQELDGAALGLLEAGEGQQRRCLARAVGADEGHDRPRRHGEGYILQGADVVIIDVQARYFKHG